MQELMVLTGNPKRRRRKHRKASRRRHRRGRRAMSPLQMQFFGKGRRNPKRRRSSGKRRSRRRHSVSRGGRGMLGRFLKTGTGSVAHPFSMVGPALTGAVGAVAVNSIIGKLGGYLPANFMTGNVSYLTRGAVAIGAGMLASRLGVGSAVAAKMAEGSLTVTLHEMLVALGANAGLNLSGLGYYLPGRQASMPSASGAPARMAGMAKYVTGPGSPQGSVIPMNRLRGMGAYGTATQPPRSVGTSFKF